MAGRGKAKFLKYLGEEGHRLLEGSILQDRDVALPYVQFVLEHTLNLNW